MFDLLLRSMSLVGPLGMGLVSKDPKPPVARSLRNNLTADHGELPLGTKVKVTREDTNQSVTVVINDRKRFKEGTVIDLAHGAADQLGIDKAGESEVSLEVLH